MEQICTQHQIDEAWQEYKSKSVFKILQHGKWVIRNFERTKLIDGTRAEIVNLHTVVLFPK